MGVDVKCRIFTDVPIEKKQLQDYLLLENQRMCQEMIRSGYYVEAMKRLSIAFPDVEFTSVYFTDLSMGSLFTEKWKEGKLTQGETRHDYKLNKTCDSLEDVYEYYLSKQDDEHDCNCKCEFCSIERNLLKEINLIISQTIDVYAKKYELHEITKMLPLTEKEDEKIKVD